jgi:hypothetical protein
MTSEQPQAPDMAAVKAGLLFDETVANYLAADPAEGGDPKALNLPSFADTQCLATCSWERTAQAPASAPAGVTWTASADTDPGLALSVNLSQTTVSPGDSLGISVTADVADSAARAQNVPVPATILVELGRLTADIC